MKNKVKQTILIMLASASILALAGCGAQNAETSTENAETESGETIESSDADTDTQVAGESDGVTVGTYPDGSSPEFSDTRLRLTIGDQEVVIRMYKNTAVDAFLERLPLNDLHFSDLSGIEKPVDRPDEAFSIADETPGYDPVTGDMVIYRPWGNFTIFYGDFRYSDELVPLGKVETGLDIISGQTEDFTGTLELIQE